jgi:hypothetical protein
VVILAGPLSSISISRLAANPALIAAHQGREQIQKLLAQARAPESQFASNKRPVSCRVEFDSVGTV